MADDNVAKVRRAYAAVLNRGDRMLVRARIYATPPGGDVPMEQVVWHAIRLRDGLAIRWDFFRTEDEARAALVADA
jgi:hypothetical protein